MNRRFSVWISTVILGLIFSSGLYLSFISYNELRGKEKQQIIQKIEKNEGYLYEKELELKEIIKVKEMLKDNLLKKEITKENKIIYVQNRIISDNEIFLSLIVAIFCISLISRIIRDYNKLKDLYNFKIIFLNKNYTFEDIDNEINKFSKKSNIKLRWNEYKETLYSNLNNNKRYQTIDSEELFNYEILYKEQIRSRIYLYIPQALVGLGMLGTFYGLTKGLSNLNLSNIQGIQGSVGELLGGVKTAFYTSLFGLSYSLLLSCFYNLYFGEIERSIFNIKNLLNEKFPKSSRDCVFDEILDKLTFINKGNNKTRSFIDNQVKKLGEDIKVSNQMVSETIKDFSDNLENNFSQTINTAFDSLFSENFITGMQSSLNQTLEIFRTSSDKMIEFKDEMIVAVGELKELKVAYIDTLTVAKSTQINFSEILSGLNNEYISKMEEMNNKLLKINSSNKDIVNQINQIKEDIEEPFEIINKNLKETSKSLSIISSDYNKFQENNALAVKQIKGIKENNIEVLNNSQKFIEEIKSTILQNIEENLKLKEFWESHDKRMEKIPEIFMKNIDDCMENIDEKILKYNEGIKYQTNEYTNEIKSSLSKLFDEYNNKLISIIENFNKEALLVESKKDNFSELLSNLEKIIENKVDNKDTQEVM